MGFFKWAAPLVRRYGDRFTSDDAARMADWLRPAVAPGGSVLDVGGGSGQLASLLADALGAHVTVLDPEPRMLAHVPTDDRVHSVTGVAERIPLARGVFDAIIVTDAFHHFRDQKAAAAEFARVARPGGTVLVLDLDPRPLSMRFIALGERIVGEPASFLKPDQMRMLMASAGIEGECALQQGASYRFLGRVGIRP